MKNEKRKKAEKTMTEEKRNKIVAAFTVNAILLIVVLFAVMIYQFVIIGSLNSKRENVQKQITECQEKTEQAQNDLDFYNSENGVLYWLIYNGYKGN
jgi:ABC-type phosphate transport system permease subunit